MSSSTPSRRGTRTHQVVGQHYHLQEIFDRLNQSYFQSSVEVRITWFGDPKRVAKRRRLLGSYNPRQKVIKIHRLLDHLDFPSYFIEYVVYHEMLHHLFPPKPGRRGRRKIHHLDFKRYERRFAEYALAKEWEEKNRQIFFQTR